MPGSISWLLNEAAEPADPWRVNHRRDHRATFATLFAPTSTFRRMIASHRGTPAKAREAREPAGQINVRGGPDENSVLDRHFLVAALRRLSSRQRQALALRYLVGLTDQEAATTLGVSPETIRTHVRRGLGTLRRRFGPDLEEALYVAHHTP